jgi:hypothetical protein
MMNRVIGNSFSLMRREDLQKKEQKKMEEGGKLDFFLKKKPSVIEVTGSVGCDGTSG